MKLYLVRHGETDALKNRILQSDDEPLSELGQNQAEKLIERFDEVSLDKIISSPYRRAWQTAEKIGKDFEVCDYFREIKKPSEFIGNSKDDQETRKIIEEIRKNYSENANWRYSDEENFSDIKTRVESALDFLVNLKVENLLVVSHGRFICALTGKIIFDDMFNGSIFAKMEKTFRLSNTGISVFDYTSEKGWKLEKWNDQSHWLE